MVQNMFLVYSCIKTLYFLCHLQFLLLILCNLRVIFYNRLFWGLGSDSNCFGFYSDRATTFIFLCFLQFWHLILTEFWSCFLLLGPQWAILGLNFGFKYCFAVHWCSWTTFIFYDPLNSDIWFWLKFGSLLSFWALMGWFESWSRVWQLFWGTLMQLNNIHFLCFRQFW